MRKALMIASMASMLDNFNSNNIQLLHEMGYEITLAANFETEDSNSREKVRTFKKSMLEKGYRVRHIDFTRKISNVRGHIKSYRQVKELSKCQFDLIHCHSPICAAMTRYIFRKQHKNGTKVIYTAHGFHFFKSAPLKNWLMYYPVEKFLSRWTDILITINQEDYALAKKKMHAKKTVYVPGVGIDLDRFAQSMPEEERKLYRQKVGCKDTDISLLSVGELNENKNHEAVIRTLARMDDKKIHYAVVGQGKLREKLETLACDLDISERVHFLGFREDVGKWYQAADIFAFPSFREGLSVSLMEAMASGKPVICSDIRGNTDLIDEGKGGYFFHAKSSDSIKAAIEKVLNADWEKMGSYNRKKIQAFDVKKVRQRMKELYAMENI